MTRHRSFSTAAARRRADPIVWEIDGSEIRLRSFVDIAEIAHAVEELQAPSEDASISSLISRRGAMIEMIGGFIEPEDRHRWDEIAPLIEVSILAEMTREAIAEYVGLGNSGAASSSSDGSSPTGQSSTDGAAAEALTQ